MAEIFQLPKVEVSFGIVLTEPEMRALYALTSYSDDSFIKTFYEKLGRSCMEPHEAGVRSLFKSVRVSIPPILERAKRARKAFNEAKDAVNG